MFTASLSNARFGESTTPSAYSWCPRARFPNTNCATFVRSRQSTQFVRQMPFWNATALSSVAHDHAGGQRNRLRDIHAILTLEAVQRLMLDSRAYDGAADTPGSKLQ